MMRYRGLKPTAKFRPSLRDEEARAFQAEIWVTTSFSRPGEKDAINFPVAAATI